VIVNGYTFFASCAAIVGAKAIPVIAEVDETLTMNWGAVLIKLDNGAHGVFYAFEVSAGRKCCLNFEINGAKSSMYWNQETADQMWMGFRDRDNSLVMRNPQMMAPDARQYTYLAAGYPEGWNDAMRNNAYSYYKYIKDCKVIGKDTCDFATFEDGHYLIKQLHL